MTVSKKQVSRRNRQPGSPYNNFAGTWIELHNSDKNHPRDREKSAAVVQVVNRAELYGVASSAQIISAHMTVRGARIIANKFARRLTSPMPVQVFDMRDIKAGSHRPLKAS